MRPPPRLARLLLSAVALLAACDTGEPDDGGPLVPTPDEIVAGVNLTALFEPPTLTERETVRAAFAARDQGLAARYTFEFVAAHEGDDGAELRVYRARDAEGGTVLFHGVVRLPLRPQGDNRLRPLLLVLPDGDGGTTDALLGALPIGTAEREEFVYALLAYRGGPLLVADTTYASDAATSPYDRDVDDALAFLAHVRSLGTQVLVDPERVGVLGLGRGGSTALLTEARTHPYDVVVDLAGPTDLFLDSFRSRVRSLLQGQDGGSFPGIEALADAIVYPLRDSAMTVEQARIELLRRSPRFFAGPPPFILVVHGELDPVVRVAHSRVLDLQRYGTGSGSPAVYLELPEDDHVSILTDFEAVSLVTSQLREHLDL